ncbi:MAG: hypothetical protein GEU98_22885 [Pseudonocardiaceae bacterium]|nr:hypothetical protein [Pseudonocardiaceae bacterium]
MAGLLELPRTIGRRLRRSRSTTPGRLTMIATGLVTLSLLTGIVGTIMAQEKRDTITNLTDYREPLSSAAQQIYRSLSDADATAATAFLNGGVEPGDLRARYELDIAQAGAALSKATSDKGIASEEDRIVKTLSTQLPVYTGLVETARANNRQGFPAGAAYLREASGLMREKILPAASRLYQIDSERLSEEQDDANSFPIVTTLLVVGLLVALIATQRYLTRKTNRVINKGLLVATIAVGVAFLWGATALTAQAILVDNGRDRGSRQVDVLIQARIAALEARADETMTLVARGEGGDYEKHFVQASRRLAGRDGNGGLLAEARELTAGWEHEQQVRAAGRQAKEWLSRHGEIQRLDQGGSYQDAQAMAIGDGARTAATAFTELDEGLVRAITSGREEFRAGTVNGGRALLLLAPGMTLLAVVAAAGIIIGIQDRLREYR